MRRPVALLLAAAALVACSSGGEDPGTPDEPLRLLVAGDSIAEGYYASRPELGFSDLVVAGLDERYAVTGVTANVSGARSWRIAERVEEVMADEPPVEVAVVEAGANDVGETALPAWRTSYARLLDAVTASSPDARVVCLGPWGPPAGAAAYERVVEGLCTGRGHAYVRLSDLYADDALHGPVGSTTSLGPRDASHPNDAGHAAIAARVLGALS